MLEGTVVTFPLGLHYVIAVNLFQVLGDRLEMEVGVFQLTQALSKQISVAIQSSKSVADLLDLLPGYVLELDAGDRMHEHIG